MSITQWRSPMLFLALLVGLTVFALAHEQAEHAGHEANPPSAVDVPGEADGGHGSATAHPASHNDTAPSRARWLIVLGRFHPLIVHLPLGLLATAALLHLINLWIRSATVRSFVRVGLLAGAETAAIAAGLGWIHAAGAEHGEVALVETHRWIGMSLAVCAAAAAVLWEVAARSRPSGWFWQGALALATIAVLGLALLAGHSGGAIVYGADYPFGP